MLTDDEEQKDDEGHAEAYHALSVFSTRYDPATEETATSQFSSREIQLMIERHVGITVKLHHLYELLREMKYNYVMQDGEFVWMVRELKDDETSK